MKIIDSEKTAESNPWIITSPEAGADVLIVEIITLALIGIVGSFIGISIKRRNLKIFQRLGLSSVKKEQVRDRQYGKCNMCFTQPSKWKYDYIDGNKSNNDLNNCQGLCSDCYLIKTQRDNRASIYQKST